MPIHKAESDLCLQIAISLLNDFRLILNSHYGQKDYYLDIATLRKRAASEGLSFFTKTLPNLSTSLLYSLESGSVHKADNIGSSKHGYPKLLKGIFRLAYANCESELKTTAIQCIYQFALVFKKLKGEYASETLKTQLDEFIMVDANLPKVDSVSDEILHRARFTTTNIFSSVDDTVWDEIIPRPGPGATNSSTRLLDRFRPNRFYNSIDDVFPYSEWFYATFYEAQEDRARLKTLCEQPIESPTSRFKFVPKTFGKARGICIEENEQQYIQQGVKRFLYSFIKNHEVLKKSIHFEHQEFNAQAALLSSRSGLLATLDMKEASDRIPRDLVLSIFSKCPNICTILDCCSTRSITFDNVIDNVHYPPLSSNKFAPMGSGVCFPIMGYVHWVLITSIIREKLQILPHEYRLLIYGDDIILPSDLATVVMDSLPKYGMKFNETKSFWKGKFRESCGTHAYNGINITPVFMKYLPISKCTPQSLQSIIANEKGFLDRGYISTAAFIRSCYNLSEVFEGSPEVGWWRTNPRYNYNLKKRRWNEDFQRWEYRIKCFKSLKTGVNYQLPSRNIHFVPSRSQWLQLQPSENDWREPDAYLRRLLVSADEHDRHWEFDRVIYQHRWY